MANRADRSNREQHDYLTRMSSVIPKARAGKCQVATLQQNIVALTRFQNQYHYRITQTVV